MPDTDDTAAPRVFYDGACPLCTREIAFYRRQPGAAEIDWVDVSRTDGPDMPEGLTREAAMARFHVQTRDGKLVGGGAAFAHLWAAMPRFRTAGAIARTPPFVWLLEGFYRLFLPARPYLQRWFARS